MTIAPINWFTHCPDEICLNFLVSLDDGQLLMVARVSTLFRRLCEDERLWKPRAIARGLFPREGQTFRARLVSYLDEFARLSEEKPLLLSSPSTWTWYTVHPLQQESKFSRPYPEFSLDWLQMIVELGLSCYVPYAFLDLAPIYAKLSGGKGARKEDRARVQSMLESLRDRYPKDRSVWKMLSSKYHRYEVKWWLAELGRLRGECQKRGEKSSQELEDALERFSAVVLSGCKDGIFEFCEVFSHLSELKNEVEVVWHFVSGWPKYLEDKRVSGLSCYHELVMRAVRADFTSFQYVPREHKSYNELLCGAVRANDRVLLLLYPHKPSFLP